MTRYEPADSLENLRSSGALTFVCPPDVPDLENADSGDRGLCQPRGQESLRALTGIDITGRDGVEVYPAYNPAGISAPLAANIAYKGFRQ